MESKGEATAQILRLNIHSQYSSLGDPKTFVSQYLKETVTEQENSDGMGHKHSLYLNSSDSLDSLMKLNFNDKKVLTVSGSGEFSHLFINDGASEIVSFDVSPVAAFNSELRHVALCALDMKDYTKLFGGWLLNRKKDFVTSIWDKGIYEKLKENISEMSRTYFDSVFNEPSLINSRGDYAGFARVRLNRERRWNRLVGDIITDKDTYKELQMKARSAKFTQVIADAEEMGKIVESTSPDTIYLSNIGYFPDHTIGIAKKYIDQGVPEVICTLQSLGSNYSNHEFGSYYYQDNKLITGDNVIFDLRGEDGSFLENVKVQIVGTDTNADYGLTIKLTK